MLEALEAITRRRSTAQLVEPGPSAAHLRQILAAAMHAPDHGRCRPWRFIIVPKTSADSFGEILESAYLERCASSGAPVDPGRRRRERNKVHQVPTYLVVACQPRLDVAIPPHEQVAAVAAAIQNLLLAATALGYGSKWATGAAATDPVVKKALGLDDADCIVGFVHLGTGPNDRDRTRRRDPDLSTVVSNWELDPVD